MGWFWRKRKLPTQSFYISFTTVREGSGGGDSYYVEPITQLNRWMRQHPDWDIISVQDVLADPHHKAGSSARYLITYR